MIDNILKYMKLLIDNPRAMPNMIIIDPMKYKQNKRLIDECFGVKDTRKDCKIEKTGLRD